MSCKVLKHKQSALNSREKLLEEGIIPEFNVNRIVSPIAKFDEVVGKMNSQAQRDYQVSIPLYTREKRGSGDYYIVPNKDAFEAIDNKRKELGIFDSQESFGSYWNKQVDKLYEEPDESTFYQKSNEVNLMLKSADILQSAKAVDWFKKRDKGQWQGEAFWKKLQSDLQIPKEQVDILKTLQVNNPYNREELLTSLLANYSYTIEINTAKEAGRNNYNTKFYIEEYNNPTGYNFSVTNGSEEYGLYKTRLEAENKLASMQELKPTQYYSNLTVPGGTNYTENEIATPAITPSIKGHAQFATDNGIGWFRSDDKMLVEDTGEIDEPYYNDEEGWVYDNTKKQHIATKTRRILEVQSDLFQKGRDKALIFKPKEVQEYQASNGKVYKVIYNTQLSTQGNESSFVFTDENNVPLYDSVRKVWNEKPPQDAVDWANSLKNTPDNQFLQLLNKDNNWVTFFTKSIIQDSAKKGYEKVLFPTGNTASKVEGHETIEEFKKQKEDRIKELEKAQEELPKEIADYSSEINQLKQELERVEKEGFAALRPIYNFYENTVTNILKKQGYNPVLITDEYGNTWNEIDLSNETIRQNTAKILLQKKGTETSRASKETVDKVKEFLDRNGFDIKTLTKETGINGFVNILDKLIGIAQDKEDVALPEEAMHVVVEMLEQNYPKLFNQMFNSIGSYELYKKVFEDYKDIYKTKDGKPDIRKIKKEAIGKVLTEYVILQNEGFTEKPENLERVKGFWASILEWIKSLINKARFNPFESAAEMFNKGVLEETFVGKEGTFYQKNEKAAEIFATLDNILEQYKLTLVKDSENLDDENDSYYTVEIDGETKKADRTTEWAKRKNKGKGNQDRLSKATEEEKEKWKKIAMNGTNGHKDIENLIKAALREDGTLKPVDEIVIDFQPLMNKRIFNKLQSFLFGSQDVAGIPGRQGYLYSFPEGTVFRVEQKIYNPNEKSNYGQGRAGTIDLIAVTPDGKIKITDWKFMGFSLKRNLDIPQNKRTQHGFQLTDYKSTILSATKKLGVKFSDLEAQTMPIHVEYKYDKEGNPEMKSITIGKDNIKEENRTYLLPVLPEDQSTGNPLVDQLVSKLRNYWTRLKSKKVSEEEKVLHIMNMEQLSKAIRHLQVRLNFQPLAEEFLSFKQIYKQTMEKYKDSSDQNILSELNTLYNTTLMYQGIEDAFISEYGSENLEESDLTTLETLKTASRFSKDASKEILNKMRDIIEQVSQKEIEDTILTPEKEVKGILSSVTEASFVGNNTIRLFTKLLNKAKAAFSNRVNKEIKEIGELIYKAGERVFDRISKKGSMELIDDISKDFKKEVNEAFEKENKQLILSKIDVEKYNSLASDFINKSLNYISAREKAFAYSEDPELNMEIAEQERAKIVNSLSLEKKSFDGYDNRFFRNFFWQSLIKDDSVLSEEYKNLTKEEKKVYQWIVNYNKRALKAGYLDESSVRFLPLIPATDIQRLIQAGANADSIRSILQDKYTVLINEEQQYSVIDPETNKPRKSISALYTRTDKQYEELSKDLFRIMEEYIKNLNHFEMRQGLEDTYLTLLTIEKNKNHLEVDRATGQVIFAGDRPKEIEGNEVNYDYLEKLGDDVIYGIQEDTDTFVDIISGKISDKESVKISTKKAINASNSYIQSLAVGLKVLIILPNYFGQFMQSIINSGGFYKYTEYVKNHVKVVSNMLSNEEKAVLDYFVPLNEDVAKQARRDVLWKQSKLDWLKTWSFNDIMMGGMQLADKTHELTNAISFLENTMVEDGKFVNIKQYLLKQPKYNKRYEDPASLNKVEKDLEEEIKKLKEERSILKTAKFNSEGYIEIPGADNSNYEEYRTLITEFSRKNSGKMSAENKAAYRRNIMARSFAMFKNWIIPQVQVRALDIHKNDLTDKWEYGRMRMFFKTVAHLGIKNIGNIQDIIYATPKGIEIMREILEQKREDYYKKTGKELTISDAEFFDMMREQIKNEVKELAMVFTLFAMGLSLYAVKPPDDEEDKNKFKLLFKLVSKTRDELEFYYNPLSTDSITRGSLLPSIGVLTKALKILKAVSKESFYDMTGDEKMQEKNKVLKYIFDAFPVSSQFQAELMPILFPEEAKDWGIKVTQEARAMR